jgi:hypothetical protein
VSFFEAEDLITSLNSKSVQPWRRLRRRYI